MTQREGSDSPARGADQWFQTMSVRFVWRSGSLEVWSLRKDQPHRLLTALGPGAAESFREWLCELVDVSQ